MRTLTRRMATVAGAAVMVAALAGCDALPWNAAASPSPTASVAVPTPAPNDLSGGSTERTLTAGPLTIDLTYWSTLLMNEWTADALKPLSMSMITTVVPADGQKVYLQNATMVVVPSAAGTPLEPLAPQADTATVAPGYLVLSPYSYSQTFTIGPVPDEATYVTAQFTFDFLVQTTPTSSEYAKQTATDQLTIAIAKD